MAARKWVWAAVAAGVLALLACGGLVGTSVYMVLRDLEVRTATAESAEEEMDRVRSGLPRQDPLVEIEDGTMHRVRIRHPPEDAEAHPVSTIHILASEPGESKLVRLQIPLWLLRLNVGANLFQIGEGSVSFARMQLRPEDIERHGPGLILDYRGRHGERVLVWSE